MKDNFPDTEPVFMKDKPAEPVIEVAPGAPTHTCSDCYAPIWSTGNGWRDRLSFRCHAREDGGHRPAVPAQEAPRVNCTCESPCHLDCTDSSCGCLHHARNKLAEPQAGAQDACEICKGARGGVPGNENIVDGVVMCDYCHAQAGAQAERCLARTREGLECAYKPHDSRNHCWFDPDNHPPSDLPWQPVDLDAAQAGAQVPSQDELRWDAIIKWAYANVPDAVVAIRDLAKEVVDARDALTHIRSYAVKAQTQTALSQFDEMQGLCRLILAESGGAK